MEFTFFCGAPVNTFGTFQTPDERVGRKVTSVSGIQQLVQCSGLRGKCGKNRYVEKEIRYIELSKTIKEKYSFLAQTQMPVTPCR